MNVTLVFTKKHCTEEAPVVVLGFHNLLSPLINLHPPTYYPPAYTLPTYPPTHYLPTHLPTTYPPTYPLPTQLSCVSSTRSSLCSM